MRHAQSIAAREQGFAAPVTTQPQADQLAQLVEALWEDLATRLHHPVAISITATTRHGGFMGMASFAVDHSKTQVGLITRYRKSMSDRFDLLLPVKAWTWIDDIVESAGVPRTLLPHVIAELKKRARRITTLRTLAMQVRTALDLDSHPAFNLALRSNHQLKPVGLLARHFNLVWKNLDAFQRVAQEHPKLLPVLALAVESNEVDLSQDPIAQLKQCLINRGMSPAGWRLLTKMGYRGVKPALERFGNADLLKIIAIYSDSLARVGVTDEPPRAFIRHWLYDIEPDMQITENWHRHPEHTLRTAFKALNHCKDAAAIQAFTREFLMVDQWVMSNPTFDNNQKKSPWKSLVGRARTAEILKKMEIESRCLMLPLSIAPFEWQGYRCNAITTSYDLYVEGITLRHCAYSFLRKCLDGTSYLFSIRLAETGKRIATAECIPTQDGWAVNDVRVFANRKARGLVRQMANQIAQRLNHQKVVAYNASEPEHDCLMDEVELWPVARLPAPAYQGRVEGVRQGEDDTDEGHDIVLNDEECESRTAFDALVAQAHGDGFATATDWDNVNDELRSDYHSYSVAYCLMVTEDHLPPTAELLCYLEGEVDEARYEDLCDGSASLTQPEWDRMRVAWIDATQSDHDSDYIHTAAVLEIRDENERTAYLRAEIGGYSFTEYVFELQGLFQFKEDALASIQSDVLPEVFARREGGLWHPSIC